MNGRQTLGAGLVFFALVSFSMALRDTLRDFAVSPQGSDTSVDTKRHLAIYILYGNAKCPTCEDIMVLTRETLQENFAPRQRRGEIVLSAANVEDPGNEWYVKTFEIFSTSVVLALYDQGQLIAWKNPQEVWDLASDPDAFKTFLRQEIQSLLEFSPASRDRSSSDENQRTL